MKRVVLVAALIGSLRAGETAKESVPPYTVEAPSGKTVYEPIGEPVDPKNEMRIQQENGVIGGRGAPMHNYGNAVKDEPHEDHR